MEQNFVQPGTKSDDELLKRDLSADSGYKTIPRTRPSNPTLQNTNKIILGKSLHLGGQSDSSDECSDESSCERSRRSSPRFRYVDNRSSTTFPRMKKKCTHIEEVCQRSLQNRVSSIDTLDIINHCHQNRDPMSSKQLILNEMENKLRMASAESLRSASPGSDSVFYSEHSSTHSVCVQRIRDSKRARISKPAGDTIVQPPAGFEDLPLRYSKNSSNEVLKKHQKEERVMSHEKKYSKTSTTRTKSEDRVRKPKESRFLTRSTDLNLDKLGASYSTSMGSDDEDEIGIYAETFLRHSWIYVLDPEEIVSWCREDIEGVSATNQKFLGDVTDSENEFQCKYESIINNIIHRRINNQLQKFTKSNALTNVRSVVVCRNSGEFGFRIRGSKPIVVSVVESASPAAVAGLLVGDIILSINNYNVLNVSHSDVLKIFQDCTDSLRLEVARAKDILSPETPQKENRCMKCGYMWRQNINKQYTSSWMLRFFKLRQDRCLYSYRNEHETIPLGAINVTKYTIQQLINFARPNTFLLTRKEGKTIYLSLENGEEYEGWVSLISITAKNQNDNSNKESCLEVSCPDFETWDHRGSLTMLVHCKGSHWKRQFCVLREARLYFFADKDADKASGVIYLHGYKVQSTSSASRRHAFELVPPDCSFKHFLFYTETSIDKRRWMVAMEQSIERWIQIS